MSLEFKQKIKSFVIRGRLSAKQKTALQDLNAAYGLSSKDPQLNLAQIFPQPVAVILEIGFGMGQHLFNLALNNPEQAFIGVEVHRPGVGELFHQLALHKINNVKVFNEDINEILPHIPDSFLQKIYILFPDPWPKRRHHKRRLIQTEFIRILAQKLKPNGRLHLATDWQDYAEHIFKIMTTIQELQRVTPPDLSPTSEVKRFHTKFESRGLNQGHSIWNFEFIKK